MQSYKKYFTDRSFLISFFTGSLFLLLSLVAQYFASNYATYKASDSVTDIVLSNTRVYDVDVIFVWGAVILFFIVLYLCLTQLKYFPFILKSVAVFTAIRSVFISLTHISPFPNHLIIDSVFFRDILFKGIFNYNDLFFSGHTGLPFLLALMFWDNKELRYLFLGFSVLFAVVVLLGHLHYSIDVLSAYFITYSIFHICRFLFKKDWQLLSKNP